MLRAMMNQMSALIRPLARGSVRVVLGFATLASGAVHADCPHLTTSSELSKNVEAALLAFHDLDWTTFQTQLDDARAAVPCLNETPTTAETARLHLLEALAAGRLKDQGAADLAFRGVHADAPTYHPPADLVAPGSLLDHAWGSAMAAGAPDLDLLPGPAWVVDGINNPPGIPKDRAALVQLRTPQQSLQNWYLRGSLDFPPDLVAALHPVVASNSMIPSDGGETETRRPSGSGEKHASRVLALSAAGAGVASLTSFLLIARPTAEGLSGQPDLASAEHARTVNNASFIGGTALGAAAGGLLVGAVIRGEW